MVTQYRDVFTALADPTRRAILELLRERPRTAGEIARRFRRMSRPAVSKHLRVLRSAQLCAVRHEGRRRYYTLDARRLAEVDGWLGGYRELWGGDLSSLQRYVLLSLDRSAAA